MFSHKMTFRFLFLLTMLLTSLGVEAQTPPLKIAIVDVEQVLRVAKAPSSIAEQIQQRRESYRQEVVKEEEALRKANKDLAQKQTLLSPEAFQAERRKFEQSLLDVQKKVQQKNMTLQAAQSKAQEAVKEALREVVLEISKERGFGLILQRAQTVVVADQLDITKDVISLLDQKLPTIKVF